MLVLRRWRECEPGQDAKTLESELLAHVDYAGGCHSIMWFGKYCEENGALHCVCVYASAHRQAVFGCHGVQYAAAVCETLCYKIKRVMRLWSPYDLHFTTHCVAGGLHTANERENGRRRRIILGGGADLADFPVLMNDSGALPPPAPPAPAPPAPTRAGRADRTDRRGGPDGVRHAVVGA